MKTLAEMGVAVLDCEHKTPTAQSVGFPYIAIPDIRDGRVDTTNSRLISADDLAEWTRRAEPRSGDILVTRRGRVGDTAPIPTGLRCAIGQNLVLLRSDGTQVDQSYLRWATRGPRWWSEVERLTNVGAVFSSLNVRDIGQIRLPMPPLKQQRAIAEVLGALDDKIAANTALAAAADSLMRAEYEALDAPYVRIDSVATSPRVKADPARLAPRDTYVGLEHLSRRNMWLSDSGIAGQVTSAKSRFEPRDVLFGKLRPYFHKVVGAPMDGICSTDILVLRARNGADASMLLAAVSSDSVISEVVAASEGTRMPRTSWKDLASVHIRWPSGASRPALSARLDSIRDSAEAAVAENSVLAETRDSLLPHLMSGKLRVRDAEAAASAAGV